MTCVLDPNTSFICLFVYLFIFGVCFVFHFPSRHYYVYCDSAYSNIPDIVFVILHIYINSSCLYITYNYY